MKNMIRNSVMIMASVLVINAAQAEGDGGLMTEMMAKKFPAQVMTDSVAQARLADVQVADDSHQNGGLMAKMMGERFSAKSITSPVAQAHLSQVVIPAGSRN